MTLNTGSVDVEDFLAQVTQFGEAPLAVNIQYGIPEPNSLTFTFGTPAADPGADDLFNIVVYQCSDGLHNTGLIADV